MIAYPITQEIEHLVRVMGFAPPRVERIIPWLHDNGLASFLVYFALYDFAAYWVHRAQRRFRWWWALHSFQHSQRQLTMWSDDRNHVFDDLLVNIVLALFAQFVGTQPEDFILILMIGCIIESWSHANIDISFGRFASKLLVSPRYHRLHHALATPEERHIQDHNFAPVLPIWDILFGTAIYDDRHRPTGVDDSVIDRDNDKGWFGQQIRLFGRFFEALAPLFRRA